MERPFLSSTLSLLSVLVDEMKARSVTEDNLRGQDLLLTSFSNGRAFFVNCRFLIDFASDIDGLLGEFSG